MTQKRLIWLASFPRSGNTMLRNAIYDAFGIESHEHGRLLRRKKELEGTFFVKTHLPFHKLNEFNDEPVIYLVRDGRDALVSLAHHKSDVVDHGSDFHSNLREVIASREGSYFEGWSKNVTSWMGHANLILRYEDLLDDLSRGLHQIQSLLSLPSPIMEAVKDFDSLKSGKGKYGGHLNPLGNEWSNPHFSPDKFFRKGEAGAWKSEMSFIDHQLFWWYHGKCMRKLGYFKNGGKVKREKFYASIKKI